MKKYNTRTIFSSFILLLFFIISCHKEEQQNEPEPVTTEGGVYIINEGNFQWGNSSVSYYSFADNSVTTDIFGSNNSIPLGDVAQSMVIFNDYGYIVVNNSGKIEIVDMTDFSSEACINGLTSPRYFLPVNNNKAYVSDLYSNKISIINLSTNTISGSIVCHGSTEKMLLKDNIVYVTNTRTSYIYLIDISTDKITDSIEVGYASNSICEDVNEMIWVLCAGDEVQHINAVIYKINPSNNQILLSLDLGNSLNIWNKLSINGDKNILYYSDNGIYKLSVNSNTIVSSPLISQGDKIFYGLGVDPESGDIYVSDAIDYIQNGMIYRYSSNGELKNSFNAGIIPSEFIFN